MNQEEPSVPTYAQLLDRIISDGLTEVRAAYADPKDHHKRAGAIEGFEACRGKMPAEIVELWREVENQTQLVRRDRVVQDIEDIEDYWKQRYKALQLEFVLNVISAGLSRPLLTHLPTYRGMLKYAEIVGVRRHTESLS